jgi:hypothetical protein
MISSADILDLVSVDLMTNAWVDSSDFSVGGDYSKVPFDDQFRRSFDFR